MEHLLKIPCTSMPFVCEADYSVTLTPMIHMDRTAPFMYNESTYETADVISTYVYRVGLLNSDFSYGTAIGLFNCLVSLILILLANGLSRKYSETSLF